MFFIGLKKQIDSSSGPVAPCVLDEQRNSSFGPEKYVHWNTGLPDEHS